ncbi:hypothetical protein L3Q82_022783 [Scortum barcoo]|uniref:Uncharacterized protein n=1 Tax=Scortum barcoo TaxID=214431 RepID=A0ACB8WZZ5_9TELE|nr:hypothetical protein L3Q82_022783 [Scortum barcoo]
MDCSLKEMEILDSIGGEGMELEGSATAAAAVSNTSLDDAANITNITFFPYYQHSLYVAASYILAYFFIFLLCMVGNILVCLIVLENRRMRTVTNLFILNLAISDLLVGIFCIPTTLVDNLITDASVTGYGECTYLRAVSATGQVHCSLIMGKARVAPTKVTTVPRLELSAAVVAVCTSDLLRKELEIEGAQEIFWTDSRVVLGYVNNEARRFHVFVANRIQRIKESTNPSQWRYVVSEENPADHASRGLKAKELIASNWFTGPDFLWHDKLPSGDIKVGDVAVEDPEVRKAFAYKTLTTEDSLLDRFLKFSSWTSYQVPPPLSMCDDHNESEVSLLQQVRSVLSVRGWPFSNTVCKMSGFVQGVSVSASVFTLVAIAVERFRCIVYPLQPKPTIYVAKAAIVLIWVLAVVIMCPAAVALTVEKVPFHYLVYNDDFNHTFPLYTCYENFANPQMRKVYTAVLFAHIYLLPLTVITLMYGSIGVKLCSSVVANREPQLANATVQVGGRRGGQAMISQKKIKVIKMLILVALLFMLSWLPLWTLMMMTDYAGLDRDQLDLLTSYIFPFAHWLAFSNSSVNPIIYGYYNENFKRGFQAVCKSRPFCCLVQCQLWRRMAKWGRKESIHLALGTAEHFSMTTTQNTAKVVKKWLVDKNINVLEWPSLESCLESN